VTSADHAAATDAELVYPHDPRDGWEPGPPSMRAMAPSTIGGALIPLGVYYLVRHHVGSDAAALALAGVPAAAWVAVEWVRRRTVDPIGAIMLFGFVAGLIASYALGGNAIVLKVRDSVFTGFLGLACLVSLRLGRRPAMFFVGRALSAGDDPIRQNIYNDLWALPPARAVFQTITILWGAVLLCESGLRVLLAVLLPTGPFLAASPALAGVLLGGTGAFTMWFSRWARTRSEALIARGLREDGGSTWWWLHRLLQHGPASGSAQSPGESVYHPDQR
jgi:hypothetical protein